MEIDPVCEMRVNPLTHELKGIYKGKTYHFCSEVCQQLFLREPEKYIASDVHS